MPCVTRSRRSSGSSSCPGSSPPRCSRRPSGPPPSRPCRSSTAPTSRSSPSTPTDRWTSTRRCTSSAPATGSWSTTRSPMSRPSSGPATRSTSRRTPAARRSTAPASRIPLHPPALSEGGRLAAAGPAATGAPVVDHPRPAGTPTDVNVERALVRSRERLSYAGAQAALDDGSAGEVLQLLREVGQLREQQEEARGGISLPLPEQEVEVAARTGRSGSSSASSCRSSGGTRRSPCSPGCAPRR